MIVIGSGFGGLAIANRLQAVGMDVTIIEKREKVGGRAYQFEEAGYTFDMGPSLITAPSIIEGIFEAAGRSVRDYTELIPLDPFYRIYFHDGSHIDYGGDADEMKEQMRRFSPADASAYDAFMEAIRPIYETVITEKRGARPFDTVGSMLSFAPRVVRLKAFLPVHMFVRRYFQDFRHRFLFSFHPLFIGGNPFRAPAIYAMIPYLEREEGVWFARGGMYSLVDALARLFVEQGGTIRTGTEVQEITVEHNRVSGVVAGGRHRKADLVVSNADVAHTYTSLLPSYSRRRWTDSRLEGMDYTMSCFLLYLGVHRQYPALLHHTIILAKRYRALVKDIFANKILPDEFSMYLHAPTRTDPSMAPPGGESLYVLIPVPNLQAEIDWSQEAEPFANRVIDFLEQWGLEDLRGNIDVQHMFTPKDFQSKYNAFRGNAFGLEPRLLQTAYFRPHNRSEDVDGLYFVGAGTHPGGGVPGVMLSAETTEHCIRQDLAKAHQSTK